MANIDTSYSPLQFLPPELLDLIMLWSARMEGPKKNSFLQRRLLCTAFDKAIRPLVSKTIQLEASLFMKSATKPDLRYLAPLGNVCEAIYLDMMIMRDEEESAALSNVFRDLPQPTMPEIQAIGTSFRQYCMGEHTFDEADYKSKLEAVVEATPNLKRFRLNLPFQIVGKSSSTSTMLLLTALSILSNRPEDDAPLETLVVDHLSDVTINQICHNHIDLINCLRVFSRLKNLVLTLKRHETAVSRQTAFSKHLWFLLRQSNDLESLCLVGWNGKRNINTRRVEHAPIDYRDWQMRCLPYVLNGVPRFANLRFLELKRVDIEAESLVQIVTEAANSLKEIYLTEVYLKIHSKRTGPNTSLWIGRSGTVKTDDAYWIADSLRKVEGLKLDLIRATGLGYDDFDPDEQAPFGADYDLEDPTKYSRSFDQRFVDAAMGTDPFIFWNCTASTSDMTVSDGHPLLKLPPSLSVTDDSFWKPKVQYDAEFYQRNVNDPTAIYKQKLDGLFINHNLVALEELNALIAITDRAMSLITEEIERVRQMTINGLTGTLIRTPLLPDVALPLQVQQADVVPYGNPPSTSGSIATGNFPVPRNPALSPTNSTSTFPIQPSSSTLAPPGSNTSGTSSQDP